MWLWMGTLLWAARTYGQVPHGAIKCYDCNYDPGLLEDITIDTDWAGKPDRGFPRCALQYNNDLGLVADSTCQGTCFIRKEYNGMVYRGCADSWNLPYNLDTVSNCTHSDDGSIWWFCTGSHCNRGTFGQRDVCPGDYGEVVEKDSSKSYGEDNDVYNRVDSSTADDIFDDIKYTDEYDEQLYNYDTSDNTVEGGDADVFDPYQVMEGGWQTYRDQLEPKSSREDRHYEEPAVSPGAGAPPHAEYPVYTYDPPQPVEPAPIPLLINPQFAEHYRSLVPDPGTQTNAAFRSPAGDSGTGKKSYDHESVKSWQPKSDNHKSWEGDEYSVSSGKTAEHVKSVYGYTDHSKSGYPQPQAPMKSHDPAKSAPSSKLGYGVDNGQTRTVYQPQMKSDYNPHVKSMKSQPPMKSAKSQPPMKSVKRQHPVKSVKSQPHVKSVKSQPHAKSVKSQPHAKSVQNQLHIKSVKSQPHIKGHPSMKSVKNQSPLKFGYDKPPIITMNSQHMPLKRHEQYEPPKKKKVPTATLR